MKAAKLKPQVNDTALEAAPESNEQPLSKEHPLPLGRKVSLRVGKEAAAIEVRSPEGEVEVLIELTETGPVVRLRGAKLEVESAEELAFRCKKLEIAASEKAELSSGGDVKITSGKDLDLEAKKDVKVVGARIFLN
jgi:hypothetical protein